MHENYRREHNVEGSSNRAFGIVIGVVIGIVGAWPLLGGEAPRWWLLVPAGIFGLLAFAAPSSLSALNRLWTKFGLLLHRLVNPLLMGIIFFLAVVPTGLILRLFRKDLLQTRFNPEAESYWISRTPPGPEPETMKNQF